MKKRYTKLQRKSARSLNLTRWEGWKPVGTRGERSKPSRLAKGLQQALSPLTMRTPLALTTGDKANEKGY